MKQIMIILAAVAAFLVGDNASACTGIALKSKDGSRIVARTVEWAKEPMDCGYAVVPRGHQQTSLTSSGQNGLSFTSKYGYVGIYTEYEQFVVEGVNEAGLSAALFFFPGFGEYPTFEESHTANTLCDMQLVSWALSTCSDIDELKEALSELRVSGLDPRVGTVHWRFSQPDGRVTVLEITGGEAHFFENPIGTLTNSPGFDFHLTNLRNYVNLMPGSADNRRLAIGDSALELSPLGGGSGMLGLPGDFTPPSRFIRAALFSTSAPELPTAFETVCQAFHILNNFDIPTGVQHKQGMSPEGLPSATQFTSVTDLTSLRLYYRTAWNQNIRCLDLKNIDFKRVKYQTAPLDKDKIQPVEMLRLR